MRTNLAIAYALGLSLALQPALADDFTWGSDGTDFTWDFVNGNWTLGGAPTPLVPDADDNVFFDTDALGVGVSPEADLNGNREVLAANFLGDSAFTLGGGIGDTLSLGTGNLTAELGADLNPHTISSDVLLLNDGVWDIGAAASGGTTLHVTGSIRDDQNGFGLTKTGDGALQVADVKLVGTLAVDGGAINADGTGSIIEAGSLIVGGSGTGNLTIADAAALSSGIVLIGQEVNSTGAATVTGTDSTLTSSFSVVVGNSGMGTLRVEAGGAVDSRTGIDSIGRLANSDGEATVTGDGSTWSNLDSVIVGERGKGTLLIEDGGRVSNRDGLVASSGGSTGDATVTGAGSRWTSSGNVYVGGSDTAAGGDATVTISDNARMAVGGMLTIWDNGDITQNADTTLLVDDTVNSPTVNEGVAIGDTGTGAMLITGGGDLSSTSGDLGFLSGSNGTATVTGNGSTWTNTGGLVVGSLGVGTLHIEDRGQVSNAAGFLGRMIGSSGTATVTGDGSTWTNTGNLTLGGALDSRGRLTIQNGGQVFNADAYLSLTSGSFFASTATVTVTGADSAWISSGSVYVGGNASSAGGDATVTISNSASMAVGGTLTVWNNGTVNFASGSLTADTIDHTRGGDFNFTGGTLAVNTFQGNLNNQGGTLSPGNSPGAATITGDYRQDGASTLLIEIDGLVAGSEFDQVLVTGTAELGGTLDVDLLTYVPQLGDRFDIIQASAFVGDFEVFDLPSLSGGLFFQTEIIANAAGADIYQLTVAPEPTTAALLTLGGLALLRRRSAC